MSAIETAVRLSFSDGKPMTGLDMKERAVAAEVIQELSKLSDAARARTIEKLRRQYVDEVARLEASTRSIDRMIYWLETYGKKPRIEKNDCTRLHKLKEAANSDRLITASGTLVPKASSINLVSAQTFVVRHDWASAFNDAAGIEDGVRLPYEYCTFEFRISGVTVIALAVDNEESQGLFFTAFAEMEDGHWVTLGGSKDADSEIIALMWAQIRAICIALDAEVATSTVVRAPHKLNAKRERDGKPPISDHHVVDLSRRHRIANASGGHGGSQKRLHFRRGHWRHYESSKTWVRWCLVGNPDLGFISKDYAL